MLNVVICGAGRVGHSIARFLTHYDTHITIVDLDKDLVDHLSNTLDVRGVHGFASHPEVLAKAGAETADVFIAVTHVDEVNMIACEVAHALFKIPTKIARIRSQTYLMPAYGLMFQDKNISIDDVLSPEIDVAHHITKSLTVPGANDAIPIGPEVEGKQIASLFSVQLSEDAPACHTEIARLPSIMPDARLAILSITRNGETFLPTDSTTLTADDEVSFICATDHVDKATSLFKSTTSQSQHVLICGGGNVGFGLGRFIREQFPEKDITIIEQDEKRANYVAQRLKDVNVLCGNTLDSEILLEAGVVNADVIAVTNDDKVNALAVLLAKSLNANWTQTLVNDLSYATLVTSLGVDDAIMPETITASKVLRHMRSHWTHNAFPIAHGFGEFIEAVIPAGAPLVGTSTQSLDNAKNIRVAGIIRNKQLCLGKDYTIEPDDRLLCAATLDAIKNIEKLCTPK
ncbi:Trk system potassium transporter TrkA [Alphaproteobacteria bacterium]|nr:Trk system potassium transporter TrkA [Alphaproteobacteria bacterium]